jgi:hypothetical protein
MDISRNTITNEIQKGNLGASFRTGDWINCLDEEGNLKPGEQEYIDAFDLQQAKIQKSSYINSCRKAEQYTNIVVNNKEYLNTETAQNKFFNLLSATTGDIDWLLADGTWTTLTREEANQVRDAIILKEKSAYQKESDLQLQIENATTVEEVNLIEW